MGECLFSPVYLPIYDASVELKGFHPKFIPFWGRKFIDNEILYHGLGYYEIVTYYGKYERRINDYRQSVRVAQGKITNHIMYDEADKTYYDTLQQKVPFQELLPPIKAKKEEIEAEMISLIKFSRNYLKRHFEFENSVKKSDETFLDMMNLISDFKSLLPDTRNYVDVLYVVGEIDRKEYEALHTYLDQQEKLNDITNTYIFDELLEVYLKYNLKDNWNHDYRHEVDYEARLLASKNRHYVDLVGNKYCYITENDSHGVAEYNEKGILKIATDHIKMFFDKRIDQVNQEMTNERKNEFKGYLRFYTENEDEKKYHFTPTISEIERRKSLYFDNADEISERKHREYVKRIFAKWIEETK